MFRRYFDDSHTWGAIFTTTTSGRNVRQLTHPPKGVLDNVPDWSPDGRHIAFQRVDPNGCGPGCETDDIWVVTSDGKSLTRVAYDPAGKGCFSQRPQRGRHLPERAGLVARRKADRVHLRVATEGAAHLCDQRGRDGTPRAGADARCG